MPSKRFMILVATCFATAGFGVLAGQQSSAPTAQKAPPADLKATIPAFHAEPPSGPLPATLDPKEFHDVLTQNAYRIASDPKLKRILYQEPCYCGCDRNNGHKSLLDCYVDHHAAFCGTCKKEMLYAYEQLQKGKSAAQIRQGIIDGKWSSVDLSAYGKPDSQ